MHHYRDEKSSDTSNWTYKVLADLSFSVELFEEETLRCERPLIFPVYFNTESAIPSFTVPEVITLLMSGNFSSVYDQKRKQMIMAFLTITSAFIVHILMNNEFCSDQTTLHLHCEQYFAVVMERCSGIGRFECHDLILLCWVGGCLVLIVLWR